MIDLHCHILPGVDDGPETLDQSLAMCAEAFRDGIRTIVATSHFRPGRFETPAAERRRKFAELSAALTETKLGIRLLPGAEVFVTPELPTYLKNSALTINGTGRYFLAEFPPEGVPPRWDSFLASVMEIGFIPIIAHPERNRWFGQSQGELKRFVEHGGLVQVTASSITGEMGRAAQDSVRSFFRDGIVQVIASDAHAPDFRPPRLAEAVERAAEIVGRDRALAMVTSIPETILTGGRVSLEPPAGNLPAARTSWFRRLFPLF